MVQLRTTFLWSALASAHAPQGSYTVVYIEIKLRPMFRKSSFHSDFNEGDSGLNLFSNVPHDRWCPGKLKYAWYWGKCQPSSERTRISDRDVTFISMHTAVWLLSRSGELGKTHDWHTFRTCEEFRRKTGYIHFGQF